MQKRRVMAYVDGFNLYHTVKKCQPNKVDLWKLFEDLNTDDEVLVGVNYFSAYAYWMPASVARHKHYIKKLEASGVKVILGQYKKKGPDGGYEEKETDINVALRLVLDGMDDLYDKAKLLTVDSDLVAAVREARTRSPEKQILIVKPPGRQNMGRELVQNSGGGGYALTLNRVKSFMFNSDV